MGPHAVGLRGVREVLVDEAAQYVVTIDAERRGSGDSVVAGHKARRGRGEGHQNVDRGAVSW
jgi:hypothetical protein